MDAGLTPAAMLDDKMYLMIVQINFVSLTSTDFRYLPLNYTLTMLGPCIYAHPDNKCVSSLAVGQTFDLAVTCDPVWVDSEI